MPRKIFPNAEEDGCNHGDCSGIGRVKWESHGESSWLLPQMQQRGTQPPEARVVHCSWADRIQPWAPCGRGSPCGTGEGAEAGVGWGPTGAAGLHSNTNTETGQMASIAGWGNDEVDS